MLPKKYLQLCNKILNIYEYLYIRKILLKGNGKGKRKNNIGKFKKSNI